MSETDLDSYGRADETVPPRPWLRDPTTRRLLWVACALLALVLVSSAGKIFGGRTGVTYTTAPVTRGPVARAVVATGTVNPELTIIVGTYVSGVIQSLSCDYNTEVKKGQVCAKIDPRPYQSQVDSARADLDVAKAQLTKDQAALDYAKLTFDRAARLVTRGTSISRDVYDNAKSAYEQAQAQISLDEATIAQRQAALESAEVDLGYTDIISPVDGTVVSRNVTTGQTVAASFQTPTLFLIASDLTRMQVDANVSESDIADIGVGDRVTFTVDAYPQRTFEGKVGQVRQSPQTVQNVVTYDVVVAVDNEDLALKPGMTASARLVTEERDDVLRVPNAAARFQPSDERAGRRGGAPGEATGPSRVWVLHDGRPAAVPVTLGLEDDQTTEIVSGDLQDGDLVITGEQGGDASGSARAPSRRPVTPGFRL